MAELIYNYHSLKRGIWTGPPFPGSSSYPENNSGPGQERISCEACRKWFHFQAKSLLKSFWFPSPTLSSCTFQHPEYKITITSHSSRQLFRPIAPPLKSDQKSKATIPCVSIILDFFPSPQDTHKKCTDFCYCNFHFPAPFKFHFISLLLQPNF